jgi:hypothetical protein
MKTLPFDVPPTENPPPDGSGEGRRLALLMFRKLGASPEDAEDGAQELLMRGKPVTWRNVRNLHTDRYRAGRARKRGGDCEHVPVEDALDHISGDDGAGAGADRSWAREIFAAAARDLDLSVDCLHEKPGHLNRLQWHRLKRKFAARLLAFLGDEEPRYFCRALCA